MGDAFLGWLELLGTSYRCGAMTFCSNLGILVFVVEKSYSGFKNLFLSSKISFIVEKSELWYQKKFFDGFQSRVKTRIRESLVNIELSKN